MTEVLDRLIAATIPEDIFGRLAGTSDERLAQIRHRYRALAPQAHPDNVSASDRERATRAFANLSRLKAQADAAITNPPVISSRRHSYALDGPAQTADIATLYPVRFGDPPTCGLLKVADRPRDNDLLIQESDILRHLRTPNQPEALGFRPLLPTIIESFDLSRDAARHRVNAFAHVPGFYNLETIGKVFPTGLDPKHVAWIWRQLLLVLGYSHSRAVVHGSVLPHHILIHPAHDLLLVDWCFAVRDPAETGTHIPAISDRYADWYPAEVLSQTAPSPATDIYMSARCMLDLLKGRAETNTQDNPRLTAFLQSCLIPAPSRRPQDAWALRDEFTKLIEQLWGPRRRIPFDMPTNHQ